jgi:3-hydroxyisobutyrate dehydrogenase-like beta-hydroxyacid dehydrogenase
MGNKIALIGLGRMGSGIAANIVKCGMDLVVWNRTASKMAPVVAMGAKGAGSAKQAAAAADIVVTSLMDDRSIIDTLNGEDGILAGLKPGSSHLCVTTISPDFADELTRIHSEHGSYYVSGPVVGRPSAAVAGELISYLAGATAAMDKARQVAGSYSKSVHVVGESARAANIIKLCINYSVVSIIEIIGEVYALAEKSGADPAIINDFYQLAFAHPALKGYGNTILNRDFDSEGGFALTGGRKDVTLMLEAAKQCGVELDIGKVVLNKMNAAMQAGMSERDWSVFTEFTTGRRTTE